MNLTAAPQKTRLQALGKLTGIHAATVCPLTKAFAPDENALANHLERVVEVKGIQGLLVNGHAGENAQLDRAEKRSVVSIARHVLGSDRFLTAGVYSEDTATAVLHARDAEEAGADAILVFPPNAWALGQCADVVLAHHKAIAEATSLPLVLYQAPVSWTGMVYPANTLAQLAQLPSVVGVKEGSWEVATYEENRLAAKAVRPDLAVLGSGDEHLLVTYLLGTEGSQVSLAAVVPQLVVELWNCAERGDWAAALQAHRRLYPLATAIYRRTPSFRATARLKACLRILGYIENDTMRPPGLPLPKDEYTVLEQALRLCS
ncbi:dihydrodipicolinate synthase family protein [Ensifer aridi]|uniref:dihydrodipicolinate synthase family protein n=1 Tax=Ensifer aridi TaxID=1708715 RepID=UPI0003FBDFB7|nr:dihydrodipicolinate synthase family protein [Ensifer aridi]